jgi:outer membrane protein assembly factor BamE (lipoprotein component of BamABCDE complex)
MKLAALVAVALCLGTATAQALNTTCKATKSAYTQLQVGMTYEQVAEIIGCEGDQKSYTDMYGRGSSWNCPGRC